MVNRVPGNFHIEARSLVHSIDPTATNVRYVVYVCVCFCCFCCVCCFRSVYCFVAWFTFFCCFYFFIVGETFDFVYFCFFFFLCYVSLVLGSICFFMFSASSFVVLHMHHSHGTTVLLLRGTIVNRTYGMHKNLDI